jgi:hypothetical protein
VAVVGGGADVVPGLVGAGVVLVEGLVAEVSDPDASPPSPEHPATSANEVTITAVRDPCLTFVLTTPSPRVDAVPPS